MRGVRSQVNVVPILKFAIFEVVGAFLAFGVWSAIRQGSISGYRWRLERLKNPARYWMAIALYSAFAGGGLVLGVLFLIGVVPRAHG